MAQLGEKAEAEDTEGHARLPAILTGLYVCRSQLSSGSKVDPDEFPLQVDGTKSQGTGQKGQNGNLGPQNNPESPG